jgi:glutathione S-transferase
VSAAIILYGYGSAGPLPDASPFVHKLENHLRLAGLAYDKRPGDARKAPRGKLPYIEHEGRQIGDSQRIIEYLVERGLADLDAGLTPAQRADAFALRSMLESDLYFALASFRWQADAGWDGAYRARIGALIAGSGVPRFMLGPVLKMVRKQVVGQLRAQGMGRREPAEIEAHARAIFDTLDSFAARSEGPFFFGGQASSFDAVMHAFVAGIARCDIPCPLADVLDACPTLRARFEHVERVLAAT